MIKNLIVVAAFATLALSCKPKTENSDSISSQDNERILKDISNDLKKGFTKNGISAKDWEEMVVNYQPHAGRHPVDGTKQNTRSVWFPLDTLDSLVTRLKREKIASQLGDPNRIKDVTDGVRLYFGRYKNHPTTDMNERNTLIFVSTKFVEENGGYHQDYLNRIKMTDPLNNGELSPPNNLGVSWGSEID